MGIKQYHLLISGRVQGVSYRMAAWQQAQQLALSGWVSNLADGRVEMIIQGQTDSLEKMIAWAEQGPRFANVSHIEISERTASADFTDFEIR